MKIRRHFRVNATQQTSYKGDGVIASDAETRATEIITNATILTKTTMVFKVTVETVDDASVCSKDRGATVIMVQPHELEHVSRWYFLMEKIKYYELGIVSNGITSIQNFVKNLPIIVA
jgi:hypothetical protein